MYGAKCARGFSPIGKSRCIANCIPASSDPAANATFKERKPPMNISLDEVEEHELRRRLLAQARLGDAAAKAELLDLYGAIVYSMTEQGKPVG
jgi:hypothetical protein